MAQWRGLARAATSGIAVDLGFNLRVWDVSGRVSVSKPLAKDGHVLCFLESYQPLKDFGVRHGHQGHDGFAVTREHNQLATYSLIGAFGRTTHETPLLPGD